MANQLRSAISDVDATITLEFSENFPYSGFVQIEDEIIQYSYSGDIYLFECIRGAQGTTAVSHAAATPVTEFVPATHDYTFPNGTTIDAVDDTVVYTSADGTKSFTITLV